MQKQVRGLNTLKALSEKLKGHAITTNCYIGDDNVGEDNDLSNNDATTNGAIDQFNTYNPANNEYYQLGHYLHSHGSKDHSQSASTPNNANESSNNKTKENQLTLKGI